ncbi:MAG: DUF5808 domain-containing protein [Chloroflexota bacterium]|nr:DUF5808 domain-containing protein [Chloroflexota bacterium]
MTWKRRMIALVGALLTVLAVLDQVGRRPEDRDWHGRVLGVPYDFRMPTIGRLLTRVWNPDDERIIVPLVFGIGWTLNLHQLKRRAQLLIA